MKHLDELNNLIDRASVIAGNDSKLAHLLGASRGNVSDWRKGTRPCPPEDQALMAGIAGLDSAQTLIRATVEKHQGKPKGDLLMKVLGKPLLATGVVGAFAGLLAVTTGSTTTPTEPVPAPNTMMIMLN